MAFWQWRSKRPSRPTTAPSFITRIPTAPGLPNSVAVNNGLVAVAVEDAVKTNPGKVLFFDTDGTSLGEITVGSLPDMLTFTADGNRVLVANEGEPNSYNQLDSVDPEGSVSVLDVSAVRTGGAATATTIGFTDFNVGGPRAAELPAGARVFGPNASVAQDLEPEYIAVHPDGTTAWVSLQEANAIAKLDLTTGTVTSITDLGRRDESLAGNGFDASDRDGAGTAPLAGNIQNWPVSFMYQPDAISLFVQGGQPYLVSANEGDSRDYVGFNEESRVGAGGYTLDAAVFPDATLKTSDDKLNRLTATTASGNTDADPQFERIDVFGSRSFSVWAADDVTQVYDSGRELEDRTFATYPANFNASNDGNAVDNRSDNKGPEPEGATVIDVDGRPVAFIGLERIGGVMAYDVSELTASKFNSYVNVQEFSLANALDACFVVIASVLED
jgi:DNA-binding beta-propeller fold protein YncE